jgi:type II secretory pathway pseudopilin PulG
MMERAIVIGKLSYHQAGFSYLAILLIIFIMGLSLTLVSENIATHSKREKETQLLSIGQQFKLAIQSYYEKSPNDIKTYPKSLEELVLDKRSLPFQKHLRQIYMDPMTRQKTWGLIKNENDEITGVYSLSEEMPLLRQHDLHFVIDDEMAKKAEAYKDWLFKFEPQETKN